jgi:VWFA-related protein
MQFSMQSRIAMFLYSLLVTITLSPIPVYAADETGYTFLTSASEVRLAFAATDRQGRAIKTLHSSDVAVADNGSIIRKFRSFRPASESPLDVVILLDVSESVASEMPAEIAEIKSFVEGSALEKRDSVSIIAFGGLRPQLLCTRNCYSKAAQMKLDILRANGATPLGDALFQAVELLKGSSDHESRPAIVLFSDGMDTISIHSVAEAARAAQNVQSPIYSVNSRSSEGDVALGYLAASTGGLSFRSWRDFTAAMHMILDDLHSGYVLTYELPAQATGQHSVRILPTSDPKLQFRSRRAYDDER